MALLAVLSLLSLLSLLLGGCTPTEIIGSKDAPDAGSGETSLVDSKDAALDTSLPESSTDSMPDSNPVDSGADSMPDTSPMDAPCALAPVAFTPLSGTFAGPITVTLTEPTAAPGVAIYYTTDGTNPSTTSPVYPASGIQLGSTTTLRAFATAPTCASSGVTAQTYTIDLLVDSPVDQPPAINPQSSIQNNDFTVSIIAQVGATICYTLDGSNAACANGVCVGSSSQYSGVAQIPIDGASTTMGLVTVNAVACAAGGVPSSMASQQYKLEAGAPTMINPSQGTLPYVPAGYNPTLSTATVPSLGPSMLQINYTTDGSTPTCVTGTALIPPATVPVGADVNFQAIACKTGYLPSAVVPFGYAIQLNAPSLPAAGVNGTPGIYDNAPPPFDLLDNNPGLPASEWMCTATTESGPICGAAQGTCNAGNPVSAPFPAPAVTATNTTVSAVACAVGYVASAPAAGAYILQLDPPGLYNPNGTPKGPGCIGTGGVVSCTAPKTTVTPPVTSYGIPSALLGIFTANVQQDLGVPLAGTPQAWDYACATATAQTPACGPGGTCSAGGLISGPFTGNGASLGPANTVQVGQTWSVQGCFHDATFAPSVVTSVAFTAPTVAGTPIVTPTSSGPYAKQLSPVITNVDTTAPGQTLCYTTDGTSPTCSNGVCGANPTGTTTQVLAVKASGAPGPVGFTGGAGPMNGVVLTAGGTGYTTAPTVTFSAPGSGTTATATAALDPSGVTEVTVLQGGIGYVTAPAVVLSGGGGGSGATASAHLTGSIVTSITVTNPGAGYTTAPTVALTGGGGGNGATAAAAIVPSPVASLVVTSPGSGYASPPSIAFTGGGGSGAAASAFLASSIELPPQERDAEAVKVVACNAGETQSGTGAQTYNFRLAEPDITTVGANVPTGNLDGGGTIGAGQSITLSTSSDFNGEMLYFNTGALPTNCAGANGGVAIHAASGNVLVGGSSLPLGTTRINVVACGSEQGSIVRSAALNITAATPTIACPGVAPATALGTLAYENTINCSFAEASAAIQPATVICYHLDGTQPSCNAGVCDPAAQIATDGSSVPVSVSNTQVVALACATNLPVSGVATATLDLSVTPVVLASAGTCPETVTVGLDQTMASSPPSGPTHGASICFSTDGTVPASNCYAGGASPPPSVTCFTSGAAGAGTASTSPLTLEPTTLRWVTCLNGFVGAAQAQTYSFTPFVFAPGSIAQFVNQLGQTQLIANHAMDAAYLSYDATTLYIGVGSTTPGSSASWTPAMTTDITIYLGNGSSQGALHGPASYGSPTLPAPAQFVLSWETDGAPTAAAQSWNGSMWIPSSLMPTVSYTSGSKVFLTVPLAAIGVTSQVTFEGAIVRNVGGAVSTYETFPALGVNDPDFTHLVNANLTSCQGPALQLQ